MSDTKDEVWKRGTIVPGYNKDKYRKDFFGAWIQYDKYGPNPANPTDADRLNFTWQIEHSHPHSKDGTDSMRNLQPMQWYNNDCKGQKYPYDQSDASVTAIGLQNSFVKSRYSE